MLSGYIFELYTCVRVQKCNKNMCIHTLAPGGRPRVSFFFFCRQGTAGLWRPQLYVREEVLSFIPTCYFESFWENFSSFTEWLHFCKFVWSVILISWFWRRQEFIQSHFTILQRDPTFLNYKLGAHCFGFIGWLFVGIRMIYWYIQTQCQRGA
jgi:hypothetical protein